MTKTDIENQLIAEFMELPIENDLYETEFVQWKWENGFFNPTGSFETTMEFLLEELLYKESWDWIMSVIQKINTIDDFKYKVEIGPQYVLVYSNSKDLYIIEDNVDNTLLENAHQLVVNFIRWYNKNK